MIAFNLVWPTIKIVDIVDILLLGLLLYQLYKLVKGSAAIKIILGTFLLYLIAWIAHRSEMQLLSYVLDQISSVLVLAIIVLFQYEIRKFLSTLGGIFFWGNKQLSIRIPGWKKKTDLAFDITAIVEAAKMLGGSNTGGLIVLSNTEDLKFYIESGDLLNALVSKRLLLAILHRESPLHDGAVIIYQSRIIAARCILPVTEKQNLPAQFGLRHRAAIGMSEVTDTLVVVISEETGEISVAHQGILQHNLSVQELRIAINAYFRGE